MSPLVNEADFQAEVTHSGNQSVWSVDQRAKPLDVRHSLKKTKDLVKNFK